MGGGQGKAFHTVRATQENFKYNVFSRFLSLHPNEVLTFKERKKARGREAKKEKKPS